MSANLKISDKIPKPQPKLNSTNMLQTKKILYNIGFYVFVFYNIEIHCNIMDNELKKKIIDPNY